MDACVQGKADCAVLAHIHLLIFSLLSLTAAYWQKFPLRMRTDLNPGYLSTKPAPLGVKASTESVSKINGGVWTAQSWPLSFHRLRYSSGAVGNVSASILTLLVLTAIKYLFRERASPANSRHQCVGDLTSGWNSVVCCLPSIAIVTCSSSTNWRYERKSIQESLLPLIQLLFHESPCTLQRFDSPFVLCKNCHLASQLHIIRH